MCQECNPPSSSSSHFRTHARDKGQAPRSSSLLLFFSSFFFEFLTSISGCYPGQEWQERERGTSKSTCKSNSGNPALFMKINSFVVDQFLFQSFDTIIYIRRDGNGRELRSLDDGSRIQSSDFVQMDGIASISDYTEAPNFLFLLLWRRAVSKTWGSIGTSTWRLRTCRKLVT